MLVLLKLSGTSIEAVGSLENWDLTLHTDCQRKGSTLLYQLSC